MVAMRVGFFLLLFAAAYGRHSNLQNTGTAILTPKDTVVHHPFSPPFSFVVDCVGWWGIGPEPSRDGFSSMLR
jgi:hypothetical protein